MRIFQPQNSLVKSNRHNHSLECNFDQIDGQRYCLVYDMYRHYKTRLPTIRKLIDVFSHPFKLMMYFNINFYEWSDRINGIKSLYFIAYTSFLIILYKGMSDHPSLLYNKCIQFLHIFNGSQTRRPNANHFNSASQTISWNLIQIYSTKYIFVQWKL